jgi:hypothetical protein
MKRVASMNMGMEKEVEEVEGDMEDIHQKNLPLKLEAQTLLLKLQPLFQFRRG